MLLTLDGFAVGFVTRCALGGFIGREIGLV